VKGASKDGKGPAPAPVANPLPWFSVATWGNWEERYNGSAVAAGVLGTLGAKVVSGHYQDMDLAYAQPFG
jgi:hypothetical protein